MIDFSMLYCIEIDYQKFLVLSEDGINFYKFEKVLESFRPKLENFQNFSFCFQLSNGFILIHKETLVNILNLENDALIIFSFNNIKFKDLCCCVEIKEKKIVYCQTKTHIIVMHLQNFQILSIYNTFHFLFYPLVNTKIDLISYFEKINFDYKTISKLLLTNEHKDIFQIADHILLVSTPKHFYMYTIQ